VNGPLPSFIPWGTVSNTDFRGQKLTNEHGVNQEVALELCLKILLRQLENSRDIVSPYDESATGFKRLTPCLFLWNCPRKSALDPIPHGVKLGNKPFSEMYFASVLKRVFVWNRCHENAFSIYKLIFIQIKLMFIKKSFGTRTRSETEARGNSELTQLLKATNVYSVTIP